MPAEAAVIDAPETTDVHAEPPMTNIGDVFKAALAKEQGNAPENEPAAKEEPKAPEPKAEEKKEPAEKAKPASALDAALGDEPAAEKKEEPPTDVLAQFDEKKPNWKAAREVMGTQSKTIAELTAAKVDFEKKMAELSKGDPKAAETIALLEKRAAAAEDALLAIDYKSSPEYKAKFAEPRARLVTETSALVKELGGDSSAFEAALVLPRGKRQMDALTEALEGVSDMGRADVQSAIAEIRKLDSAESEQAKESTAAWERLQLKTAEDKKNAQSAAEQRKEAVFGEVIAGLPKTSKLLGNVAADVPGAEEWNGAIKTAVENARKLFGPDADMRHTVQVAIQGEDYPRVEKMLLETSAELKKARATIAEYEKSEPDFKSRAKPKSGDSNLDKTPGQIFTETMAKFGAGDD